MDLSPDARYIMEKLYELEEMLEHNTAVMQLIPGFEGKEYCMTRHTLRHFISKLEENLSPSR